MKRPELSDDLLLRRIPKIGTPGIPKIGTPEGFAMVVNSVLDDAELTHGAVRVFANLARSRKKGAACVTIGLPRLAKISQCSVSTTVKALAQLIERNHIRLSEGQNPGDRRTYRLLSRRYRDSVTAESASEVIEYYTGANGVRHKRIVKTRDESPEAASRKRA